ncbi:7-cyano-7-deazaguanine synthase [Nitrosopumilus sp. b1]|uniref:7-cyano-7-deazaguanine synthase n=1 Tax=Nitrosopumilus sp. b1 TaxID=2109907 RepID=UPI0015F3B386|nr:7-cyano-7-deazaguanine synthase [Nitrosopumilus sp. b1]KAF6243576.1 7-cyano-7-deazaguanine synthase [Nitrosopumilus sp. b1]
MKKAVVIFSGGIDSVCTAVHLKPNFQLYGITFSYGQRADQEIKIAKKFSKSLGFKEHKIVNIGFMRDLYGKTNVLTDSKRKIPQKFEYSIVVPIRNAVFLSISSAWAYTLGASIVAYGAHKGDTNYPDCRPSFAKKIESAFNEGEIDGIKKKIRKPLEIWSPYRAGLSKSDLIKIGQKNLGLDIFKTWSCYESKKFHCGKCESCNNRKVAFSTAGVTDQTRYL